MNTSLRCFVAAGAALLIGWFAAPIRADILYVANYADSTIAKFSSSGAGSLFATPATSPLNRPVGLAFDSAGYLYTGNIADQNPQYANMILKFDSGGAYSIFFDGGTAGILGLSSPHGMAFDSAGHLYVASTATNTIGRFVPGVGGIQNFATTGLNVPQGLAFDSAGSLYVANYGSNTIEKVSSTGTDLGAFASSGLNGPLGLAFDGAGNLYASNYGSNTIEKFSSTGTDFGVFASTGLNGPMGLAFDSAGNLYVANYNGNTIEKVSSTGTDLGVFANSNLGGPVFMAFTNDAGQPLALPNQLAAVPEPSSLVLCSTSAGVALICWVCNRRRRAADSLISP